MTNIGGENTLTHLSPAAARLGAVFARPRVIAAICVVALTGLGWSYLGILTAGSMARDNDLMTFLGALCRPAIKTAGFGMPSAGPWGSGDISLLLMWCAMTLAMMLPSAAPMILTYAEIADTAMAKGEPVVSPFVLTAGYALVWICFAAMAAISQAVLTRVSLIDAGMAIVSWPLSGAIFIGAGLYQFTSLKQACLAACQRPFPFFFTHWTMRPAGVLRLGLRQGLHCLGCCWAMMLLMFAIGVMNVAWMAVLGAIMAAEKLAASPRMSHVFGALFIAIGVIFIAGDAAWSRLPW